MEVELSEEQLHVARRFGAADQGSLLRGQGVERFLAVRVRWELNNQRPDPFFVGPAVGVLLRASDAEGVQGQPGELGPAIRKRKKSNN